MKKITVLLPIIFIFFTSAYVFGQTNNEINLFAGAIQENGLPKGWMRAVDNYECTIKFENDIFYFERHIKDEKCSFGFSQPAENSEYLVKATFEIDGNGYEIFLDNEPLYNQNEVAKKIYKVTDGRLSVGFRTKGEGKVWGHVFSLTATKLSYSNKLPDETIEKIKEIAANSKIAKYSWKNNQGVAPIGYTKGIAVTYAKSYRELKTNQDTAIKVISQPVGDKQTDALAWYGITANSAVERLRAIYALAMGEGMLESSGNPTAGWDKSKLKAKPPIQPTVENSEAGVFQVSWDSRNNSPWLLKLYEQYQANPNQCSLSIFMEKSKDWNAMPFGEGDGLQFQKFMKECPALSTEYGLVMFRVNRRHFGPINVKKAEYNLDAEKMFKEIEKVVDPIL